MKLDKTSDIIIGREDKKKGKLQPLIIMPNFGHIFVCSAIILAIHLKHDCSSNLLMAFGWWNMLPPDNAGISNSYTFFTNSCLNVLTVIRLWSLDNSVG